MKSHDFLAKSGRTAEALRAFDQPVEMGPTPVGGLPAGIIALEAKCSLLEKVDRAADLKREARVLHEILVGGRWPLSHASYEFRFDEARRWPGELPVLGRPRLKPPCRPLSKPSGRSGFKTSPG
ncbi:MAG: hypothetical protein EHM23_24935 [Acidobacteria bacterium]|nr:MAG: hypothetical protein EHM23_24935 [Acidobacteriota bacterium]